MDKTAPGGFLPWGNFGSRREVETLGGAKKRALRSEGVEQLDEDEEIRGVGEGIVLHKHKAMLARARR